MFFCQGLKQTLLHCLLQKQIDRQGTSRVSYCITKNKRLISLNINLATAPFVIGSKENKEKHHKSE